MLRPLHKAISPILSLPRSAKRCIALLVDISLCILTVWLALYLRLGEFVALSTGPTLWAAVLSVAIALPIFVVSGVYRAIFRYSGFFSMVVVLRAVVIYGLLYASVITAIGIAGVPRTVGLIQPLLLVFAIVGSRAMTRYWFGGAYQNQLRMSVRPRALVYGAGVAGRQLVSALENGFEMRVEGFLDDDEHLHGHVLNGQPIFSPDDLGGLIESRGVSHVLMAIPSAGRHRRNEILKEMSRYKVVVRTLPSVADMVEGRVTVSDLHDLDIDDLLSRGAIEPNYILLAKNISERVVLVTGAGGSIGSELCRQIIMLRPAKLLLLDISEFALYSIHSELKALCQVRSGADVECLVPLLGSVQDKDHMSEIIGTWVPDTIYHAAAYKHVPLVEHNVAEGLKNNIFGTLTVVQVAIEKGVSDFVLISTDKAVRPTNVMGASKRLAELCLQALFAVQKQRISNRVGLGMQPKHSAKTQLSIVRFGNVLDSSGSVIPKFRKQIREGGPITVTHPEIKRYFMTIPEAAQLVIQAGAMAKGGDVFVLDMGEPVSIVMLARRMVELSGLTVRDKASPDGDIEIMITGLRPGEKLYEELMLGDDPQTTMHPKIRRAKDPFILWHELKDDLEALRISLTHNDVGAILTILGKLVSGYEKSDEAVDWISSERMRRSSGSDGLKPLPIGIDQKSME